MPGALITQSIQPTQRGLILYSGSAAVPTSVRNKTSAVFLGRTVTGNAGRVEASAAGAITGIYMNPTTYSNVGPYFNYLYSTASGGPSLQPYPDGGNSWGKPVDLLALSDAQLRAKILSTIRKMKDENPWMNAVFCDDSGPTWTGYLSLSAAVREAFYGKQVVIAQAFRDLADELGLFLMCNAMWDANANQGYPVRNVQGCSLYDAFCIEHHAISELPFWLTVAAGQWRMRDPQGQRLMFVITSSAQETADWRNRNHMAWIAEQTTPNYTANPPNVSLALAEHDLGFSVSGGGTTTTVGVTPSTPEVQTGGVVQFTATVTPSGGSVTWSVNGVNGGNATVGTITSGGLYTAPTAIPQGGVVTVRATHTSGAFGSTSVTVKADPAPPEQQLPAPPAIPNKAFGNRFIGTTPNNMSPNYARGVVVIAPPEDGLIDALRLGVDGFGPGTAPQPYTLYVYSIDGQGLGGVRRGGTVERTVQNQDAPAWPRSAATSQIPFTASEPLILVIHSGGTEATSRFFRNETPQASRGLDDPYADGPVASFAGSGVGAADICIYAEYTPVGQPGASLAGRASLTFRLQGNARAQGAGGSVVDPNLVLQRNRFEQRLVPVSEFFLNLGGGVPGARLIWQASDQTFRFADEQ